MPTDEVIVVGPSVRYEGPAPLPACIVDAYGRIRHGAPLEVTRFGDRVRRYVCGSCNQEWETDDLLP